MRWFRLRSVSDRSTGQPKRLLLLGLVCLVPMLPYAPGLALWASSHEAVIQVSSVSVEEWTARRGPPMQRVRITRVPGGETPDCRLYLFQGDDVPKTQPFSVPGRVSSLGRGACWVHTDISALRTPFLVCLLIFAAAWRFSSGWLPGAGRG